MLCILPRCGPCSIDSGGGAGGDAGNGGVAPHRLRVGYIGYEFGNFPVGKDMRSVFGLHDPERFEVFAYALNPDDGSPWRGWIRDDVEHFRELAGVDTAECARMIHRDGIHILISMTGYTRGERSEILALRPSPLQVFFKGFMGTSGAPFTDYIMSDAVSTPPQLSRDYTEKYALLNGSFFVSDYPVYHKVVVDPAHPFRPTRAAYGVPEDAFVFCLFNQLYKVDPEVFDAWARILKRVPGSVLWLLKFPEDGVANILKEAAARGIEASRIIFMGKYPDEEHLKIKGLADLFLDTPLYNAHGSATDILWAGVPVVTLLGHKMASRVAASMLTALGLPELVTRSLREYEDLAVRLATDREEHARIRAAVRANRFTSSLFNTGDWVRRAEAQYMAMWEAHVQTSSAPHIFQ